MYENSNGGSPQTTEGAQSVAGWLGVEPEDRLAFGDHDERLERKQKRKCGWRKEPRPEPRRWGRRTFCVWK